MKARVPKHGNPTGYVVVETDATVGATIGTNLFNADGTLFDLGTFTVQVAERQSAGVGTPPSGETVIAWNAVQNVPTNLKALVLVSDDGFLRKSGATWTASPIVNADLSEADTDGLAEGGTNLYFTDVRARAANATVSKTLAYDGSDRLSVVTDSRGTKTMTYDGSDKLTAIAGTGEYPDMTFTYSGDQLTAVTVT